MTNVEKLMRWSKWRHAVFVNVLPKCAWVVKKYSTEKSRVEGTVESKTALAGFLFKYLQILYKRQDKANSFRKWRLFAGKLRHHRKSQI
jgi:hypothetical protein